MATKPAIRLMVGALTGDADITAFREDLKKIADKISQNPPQIALALDVGNTTSKLQSQLNDIVKNLKVNPVNIDVKTVTSATNNNSPSNSGSSNGGNNKAANDLAVLSKQLQPFTNGTAELGFQKLQQKLLSLGLSTGQATDKFAQFEAAYQALANKMKTFDDSTNYEDFLKNNQKELRELVQTYAGAIPTFKDFQAIQSATNINENKYLTATKNLQNLILQMEKYLQVNDKIKTDSTRFGAFSNMLSNNKNVLDSGKYDPNSVDRMTSAFKTLQLEMRAAGLEGQTFGTRIKNQLSKLGIYFGAAGIFMMARRVMSSVVSEVKNLDLAMTELKKVTDETDASYSKFLDNAETRAKNLGATLTDVVTATADFARLGYTISEAEDVSDAALIYKNVGDGINDVTEAAESIISTMKAFKVETEDAMTVVDRFNKIGNNFSISSKGVGEGLKRSASALATAGNTIDESIALIVAANEVVQDPEVVGTALKTAALRLTSSAGQLEELGEDAEGAAESITKLQTQLLNLTGGKVDIMIDESTFKSSFKIMQEMSAVWDDMTQKDRLQALELMFGKRAANVGASIIENMATAEDALGKSINSAGSAMEENEKYLDSIAGKSAQFQAEFQAFSSAFIDSDLIKGTIDASTGILGFFTALTKFLNENIVGQTIRDITLLTVAIKALQAVASLKGIQKLFNVGRRKMIRLKCA